MNSLWKRINKSTLIKWGLLVNTTSRIHFKNVAMLTPRETSENFAGIVRLPKVSLFF